MKTQSYFHTVFGRVNLLKRYVYAIFFAISSYPRLLLEVFVRARFGIRYFKLSSAVTLLTFLGAVPLIIAHNIQMEISAFIGTYLTWYLYLAAFLYRSLQHWKVNRRKPGSYESLKFTQYAGDRHPLFLQVNFFGREPNVREIATILEPTLFLIIGIIFISIAQPIGYIITFCSIIYALSWRAAYYMGDEYILDVFDQIVFAEQVANVVIERRRPIETRGFEMYADLPNDHEFSRKIVDFMNSKEETLQAS